MTNSELVEQSEKLETAWESLKVSIPQLSNQVQH